MNKDFPKKDLTITAGNAHNGRNELQNDAAKKSLGEIIMSHVADRESFTGQVTVEVHCKAGEIRDVYLIRRSKFGS